MGVKVEIVDNYSVFGRCVRLTNGTIEALATLDIGPRIMRYAFIGGGNVLHNDVDDISITEHESMDTHYYKGAKWHNYGGHRLWASPESMPETYFPDCEPVEYELGENSCVLTQRPQTQNGIACSIELTMNEDGSLRVDNRITNISGADKVLSAWAITVLSHGGVEIIPQNTVDTELLPNRRLVLWQYSDIADARLKLQNRYITLRQDENGNGAFKLGLDNHSGTAVYLWQDVAFKKQYCHNLTGNYDDFGVSFETYTNEEILEMETLGEITELKNEQTVCHTENWSLAHYNGGLDITDENAVGAFLKTL